MLINFAVKNYKSFKDTIILDLEATNIDDHNYLIPYNKYTSILPVISIFGANGSGKSNLIDAIMFAKYLVWSKDYTQIYVEPFKFDKYAEFDTTTFEFEFIKNETHYIYNFTVNHKYVYNENLYIIDKNGKKRGIFRRDADGFVIEEETDLELAKNIQDTIQDYQLFLSVASRKNYKPCQDPFEWFCKDLIPYNYSKNNDNKHITFGELTEGECRYRNLEQAINNVIKKGNILIVDILEKDLHPLLIEKLIDKFLDKEINKNNAQLIFTTNNVDILARKLLRHDQIYFVNKVDNSSELYSLADFDRKYSDDIYFAYMLGKFGGVPED